MTMESYALASSFVNTLASIFLGGFVLTRNPRRKLNITYFVFSFSVAFWSFFYHLWLHADSSATALFYCRLLTVGAIMIPVFYLHHLFILLRLEETKRKILKACYLFGFICLGLNTTPFFVKAVSRKLMFEFWPEPGILYHPFVVGWLGICLYTEILIFKHMRNPNLNEMTHHQMKYLFLGTAVGYAGGATNFFLLYDIPIPPVGNILVSFYVLVTAYAIVRYRLMDIQVIIKKTLVFAGLLSFVLGVFSFGLLVAQEILALYFGFRYEVALAISIFLIVLGYEPMREFLIHITDRFLFQKRYNYQQLLKDASRGMSRIESLDHLMRLVVHFVTMKMRLHRAAILTWREDCGDYKLDYQRGYAKVSLEFHVSPLHPLIQYLKREKEALDIERIREYQEAGGFKKVRGETPREYDWHAIQKLMQEMGAACLVPSFLGKELRNVLVLGEKKSGDIFTSEDLNVLFTLAQESAIAIENARLYDEAIHKSEELEHINAQLEFSKDLLAKALKETEVANKQLQDTQAQLIHEQKMATLGRLAASVGHEVNNPLTILSMNVSRILLKYRKNPDVKVSEILDVFDKMEQNINRIKAVVNTLTGLLRKSEKGKFEPLSLKLILEETLPLVQFQTYLDNLTGTEVEFNVPSNLPLVRGDLERLQEVFLNLFINAYHAMAGKRYRKIRVWAHVDPQDSRFVVVNFQDTGSGMTKETMAKIFNYGYTTKPPGKGSGLGLYMCKYIIELHGGTIRVASEVGVGTTFTLTLPIDEESALSNTQKQRAMG